MQAKVFCGGVSVNVSVCVLLPTGSAMEAGETVPAKESNQTGTGELPLFVADMDTV
jgi:hypothetical protein